MPTLHVHSYELFLIARKAAKDARADASRPNALTTDSIVAVVMAAAAAEGFLSELAYHVEIMRKSLADWAPGAVTTQLGACADAMRELERQPLAEKYLKASESLSGRPFDKGCAPLQDFVDLVRVRDEVMHVKPVRNEDDHLGTRIATALEKRVSPSGYSRRLVRHGFICSKTPE